MEAESIFRFVLALVVVLGLIVLLAFVARRFGLGPRVTAGRAGRRVQVVEVTPVDAKRQLILVRRDATEHLILLGTAGDIVVERGIAAQPAMAEVLP